MPLSTLLIVCGSWVALLILTILYYFVWSGKEDDR
jgi:hypothetical protein